MLVLDSDHGVAESWRRLWAGVSAAVGSEDLVHALLGVADTRQRHDVDGTAGQQSEEECQEDRREAQQRVKRATSSRHCDSSA
jgi:hypothetical protein